MSRKHRNLYRKWSNSVSTDSRDDEAAGTDDSFFNYNEQFVQNSDSNSESNKKQIKLWNKILLPNYSLNLHITLEMITSRNGTRKKVKLLYVRVLRT